MSFTVEMVTLDEVLDDMTGAYNQDRVVVDLVAMAGEYTFDVAGTLTWHLEHTLGLKNNGDLNYGGLNERWLQGSEASGTSSRRRENSIRGTAAGLLRGHYSLDLDPMYYTEIERLNDVQRGQYDVTVYGDQLLVESESNYVGRFWVYGCPSETNRGPILRSSPWWSGRGDWAS